MPLVVETGAIVAGANSYVTLDEARAFAQDRGLALPPDDGDLSAKLILAADYLSAVDREYVGSLVASNQPLPWPRSGVVFNFEAYPEDEIPPSLKRAQILLAVEATKGVDLMPSSTGKFVKRRKVGPLETEWSESVNPSGLPRFPQVDALLAPLFTVESGFTLTTLRI